MSLLLSVPFMFGAVIISAFLLLGIMFQIDRRLTAQKQLEELLAKKNVDKVGALLMVRGHLLTKQQRESAQIWVASMTGMLNP